MPDGLLAVAAKVFGIKLHPQQRALLESLTPGSPNAVWACGRRGGKTLLCAIVALYDLLFRPDLDAMVRQGEPRYAVCVCTNQEQGRVLLRQAKLIVDSSRLLRGWLAWETQDELGFKRDGHVMVLRVFPCSSRGLRGFAIGTAIMDEAAHYVNTEDGDRAAATVYTALRPAVAQFGHAGRFLVVSSPSGETGWFAETWHRVFRGELEGWSSAQMSTAEMNPKIPADFLAQVERDEPDTFGSEYLALFESGGNAFFDMSRFAVGEGLEPAGPVAAVSWKMGADPGFTGDGFGYALIGRDSLARLVVGPVGAIVPRFKRGWTFDLKRKETDRVLSEIATMARNYSASVTADQHQSVAVADRLRSLGVNASVLAMTREVKLACFRELRDRLYDGSLVLPDQQDLLDELRRVRLKLEQGGAKVILPRSSRGHCDQVQALAVVTHRHRHEVVPQLRSSLREWDYVPPWTAGIMDERF